MCEFYVYNPRLAAESSPCRKTSETTSLLTLMTANA